LLSLTKCHGVWLTAVKNYNKSLEKLQDFFFKTETKTKKICAKSEFWAWNEIVNVWWTVRVVSTEQVGNELESVTSSAACFMQGWRNETKSWLFKTNTSWSKIKTFILVLEAPWDQDLDPGLEAVSEMTYTVSSGTLNSIPYHTWSRGLHHWNVRVWERVNPFEIRGEITPNLQRNNRKMLNTSRRRCGYCRSTKIIV